MKSRYLVAVMTGLGLAVVASFWWGGSQGAVPRGVGIDEPAGGVPIAAGTTSPARASEAVIEATSPESTTGFQQEMRPDQAKEHGFRGDTGPADPGIGTGISWPVKTDPTRAGGGAAAATGDPVVHPDLAFSALRYVGIDPEAERTWVRAINDANMPADIRSDLIEDLNEQGYTDNSRPTKEDLPLILARLELIERLAPLATDDVNAAAFEEAYKDLLDMYIRLGGEPRDGR